MKKKYGKYFVFLMVSFLSTSFFIGRVRAAHTCTYSPGAASTVSYYTTSTVIGKGTKTFYKIWVNGQGQTYTAYCLKPGVKLHSNLVVKSCNPSDANGIRNTDQAMVNRAKKAINYCRGKSCGNPSKPEYAAAQTYIWGLSQKESSAAVRLVCQLSIGDSRYKHFSKKEQCNQTFDDSDDALNNLLSKDAYIKKKQLEEFEKMEKMTKDVWSGIASSSMTGNFTCLQDVSGKEQPVITLTEVQKCNDTCTNEEGKEVPITDCVNKCVKDGGNKTTCTNTCIETLCPYTKNDEDVCPPESDYPGKSLSSCVTLEMGKGKKHEDALTQCIADECYTTKSCSGVSYKYINDFPNCTNDGNGKIAEFKQVIDLGVKGTGSQNGEYYGEAGTYGGIYCKETSAKVNLPGGLNRSLRLGGYFIWPTSDNSNKNLLASTGFGNMYPLSFQGEMECHFQMAPDLTTSNKCNVNVVTLYETAYESLVKAANDTPSEANKGITQNDIATSKIGRKTLIDYEAPNKKLTDYLGISAGTWYDTHTRETIRKFAKVISKDTTCTYKDNTPELKEVKDDFVLHDPTYIKINTSSSILSSQYWKTFVENHDILNTNLKNADKVFDFSKVNLTAKNTYTYTMKYAFPVASGQTQTWYTKEGKIQVVDELPETVQKGNSYKSPTETCGTPKTVSKDNACLKKSATGCADEYFASLERWRKANYDYWDAQYTAAWKSCHNDYTYDCNCDTWNDGTKHNCKTCHRSETWCRDNNKNGAKDKYNKRQFWSENQQMGTALKNMKAKFNLYAEAYGQVVDTYMQIWQTSYYLGIENDSRQCNGDSCAYYNFETGAKLSYQDETGTPYKSYGESQIELVSPNLNSNGSPTYTCKIGNTDVLCGKGPLVEMYPKLKHFASDLWESEFYAQLGFSADFVNNMNTNKVKDIVNKITSTEINITTNEIFYNIPEDKLYKYISKGKVSEYSISKPSGNFEPIQVGGVLFGVLPTSYGNKVGKEYDLKLDNFIVGNNGAATNRGPGFKNEYVCNYKVTNDTDEDLKCPPGTNMAGMLLDLVQLNMSYEEAVAKYCDGNPPDPICPPEDMCYYCTDASGAKIDITTCVGSKGGDYDTCAAQYCKRYYCPKNTPNEWKEITNCVQNGNSYNSCVSTLCGKNGNKLFVYRTIDLNNPFPSMDADKTVQNSSYKDFFNLNVIGRKPGSNWFSGYLDDYTKENNYVKTKIIHNRNTDDGKAYEVYTKEPLYHFVLDRKTLLAIRNYNKEQTKNNKGGYADFNLTCITTENHKYVGMACRSSFVHSNISGIVTKDTKCGNAKNSNDLIKCLYGDETGDMTLGT